MAPAELGIHLRSMGNPWGKTARVPACQQLRLRQIQPAGSTSREASLWPPYLEGLPFWAFKASSGTV